MPTPNRCVNRSFHYMLLSLDMIHAVYNGDDYTVLELLADKLFNG